MSVLRVGVVLFDGVCNLCNGAVRFIVDRDRAGQFAFAALQSAPARSLLAERHVQLPPEPESLLLVEGDTIYQRSTAVLRIARHLRWPWSWAYAAIVIPRPVRDAVYRFVARRRYRWFGKRESCRVPTAAERPRFLS